MVVIVDKQEHLTTSLITYTHQGCQLIGDILHCTEKIHCIGWKVFLIVFNEFLKLFVAVVIHPLLVPLQIAREGGEVKVEHQVGIAFRSGVLTNPQVTEETVEAIGLTEVIILPQHTHQQRFAEASRTDEKKIAVGFFYFRDKTRLINIIVIGEAQVLPILHPIREALGLLLLGGHGWSEVLKVNSLGSYTNDRLRSIFVKIRVIRGSLHHHRLAVADIDTALLGSPIQACDVSHY